MVCLGNIIDALLCLHRSDAFIPRSNCNQQIVIVGNSDASFAAMEHFICDETYFPNLILLSNNGFGAM